MHYEIVFGVTLDSNFEVADLGSFQGRFSFIQTFGVSKRLESFAKYSSYSRCLKYSRRLNHSKHSMHLNHSRYLNHLKHSKHSKYSKSTEGNDEGSIIKPFRASPNTSRVRLPQLLNEHRTYEPLRAQSAERSKESLEKTS